jgi:hypothetical protein
VKYYAFQRALSGGSKQLGFAANATSALGYSSGSLAFYTYDSGTVGIADSALVDGRTHTFLFVRRGGTFELFADGTLRQSATKTVQNVVDASQEFALGTAAGSSNPWPWPIEMFAGWNRALTITEAKGLSANPWQMIFTGRNINMFIGAEAPPAGFNAYWARQSSGIIGGR